MAFFNFISPDLGWHQRLLPEQSSSDLDGSMTSDKLQIRISPYRPPATIRWRSRSKDQTFPSWPVKIRTHSDPRMEFFSDKNSFQIRTVLSDPPIAKYGRRNFAQCTSSSCPESVTDCPDSDKFQTVKLKLSSLWVTLVQLSTIAFSLKRWN